MFYTQTIRRGFTLIEVLVAVSITAIGIFSLLQLQLSSAQQQQINATNQRVQWMLEDLRQIALIQQTDFQIYIQQNPIQLLSNGQSSNLPNTSSCTYPCSKQQFVQYQVESWLQRLDQTLQGQPFTLEIKQSNQHIHLNLIWAPFDSQFDPKQCYQTLKNCQQTKLNLS